MEIEYENNVYDQEGQTKRLLRFCGLEWDEARTRFHENAAAVSTASSVHHIFSLHWSLEALREPVR